MNNAKAQWHDLLKKDMSRKEFLGFIGMAALVVFNIAPLFHLFSKGSGRAPVDGGYGSTGYSGFVGDRPAPGSKAKGFDD